MDKRRELRTDPSSIGGLTIELERVVEQLESDWRDRHRIGQKAAEDLHNLRVRAEKLLSNAA